MSKEDKIAVCLKFWVANYGNKTKWFEQDKKDYINFLGSKSDIELEETYNRLNCLNSKSFERAIEKEVNKLVNAGLYDMNNLKPENQLS